MVTSEDLDVFEAKFNSEEEVGELQWFGFKSMAATRKDLSENGLIALDGGQLVVATPMCPVVGRVQWKSSHWGRPETSWCWEIGIILFREFRNQGIGTKAQRLLTTYLFENSLAQRLQAATDAENAAEKRSLEKTGYIYEGTLRAAQWRKGKWHDQHLYSLLRTEWVQWG